MGSKKDKCKHILKYIPEPNRTDLFNISNDVGCSERTVYRALKELRKDNVIRSKYVTRITKLKKEIESLEKYLKELYILMVKNQQPHTKPSKPQMEVLKEIEKIIGAETL